MDAIAAYEAKLAASLGARRALAFGHARHALVAILRGAGLGEGDRVVLAPLTCKVVPLALAAAGIEPVYADIDAATLNLSADRAREVEGAKAVLFQHTYGSARGISEALEFAAERDWLFIDDCAQCLPSKEGAPTVGVSGPRRAAILSNNLMKPLPAGSGGLAATNDEELARGIESARGEMREPDSGFRLSAAINRVLHAVLLWPGSYWLLYGLAQRTGSHYEMRTLAEEVAHEVTDAPGRISTGQARIGRRALDRVAELVRHRREACTDYTSGLAPVAESTALELPEVDADAPLYYRPALVPAKDQLLARAKSAKVEIVPWPLGTPIYPVERPEQLATYGYQLGSCPVAEEISGRLVGLPTHARMSRGHRAAVIELLRRHCEEAV